MKFFNKKNALLAFAASNLLSASALACTYGPNDDSTVIGDLVCNDLDRFEIFNGSTTVFNGINAESDGILSITSSTPTFNSVIFEVLGVDVNSAATFNNSTITVTDPFEVRNAGGTIFNNTTIFGNKININKDASATFQGTISAPEIFINGGATANFAEAAVVNAPVRGADLNFAKFGDEATINSEIGSATNPVNTVSFKGVVDSGKSIKLNNSINASLVEFNNSRLAIEAGQTINGTAKFSNKSTIDLSNKTLAVSGLNAGGGSDMTLNTSYDGTNLGNIRVTSNSGPSTADLTSPELLTINLNETSRFQVFPQVGQVKRIPIFVVNEGASIPNLIQDANVTFNVLTANPFVSWTYSEGVLEQRLLDNYKTILEQIINDGGGSGVDFANLDIIAQNLPNISNELLNRAFESAGEAANYLANLATADYPALAAQLAKLNNNTTSTVHRLVASRGEDQDMGVAAGDDYKLLYGSWASVSYGTMSQKELDGVSGYSAKNYGGTVGADTLINDDFTLGVAFNYTKSKLKHKDFNTGDRTDSNIYLGTIYGKYNIDDKWYTQGGLSVSKSDVKNREIVIESGQSKIAAANFSQYTYDAIAFAGYKYMMQNTMTLTPRAGLNFTRIGKISYTESGTVNRNRDVRIKARNRIEGIVGARLSNMYTLDSGMTLRPDIHANFHRRLSNKEPKSEIRIVGIDSGFLTRERKQSKNVYNVGLGLSAKPNDIWEYKLGYDMRKAKKFVGHQGVLKVKVKF